MTIGSRISELRKKHGMTQKQLADEINLSQNVICKMENDLIDCKTDYTVKLSEVFHVSTDYLLTGVEEEHQTLFSELGLSEKVLGHLTQQNMFDTRNQYADAINSLFQSGNQDLIVDLADCITKKPTLHELSISIEEYYQLSHDMELLNEAQIQLLARKVRKAKEVD